MRDALAYFVALVIDKVGGMFGDKVEKGEERPEGVSVARRKQGYEEIHGPDPLLVILQFCLHNNNNNHINTYVIHESKEAKRH